MKGERGKGFWMMYLQAALGRRGRGTFEISREAALFGSVGDGGFPEDFL